MTWRPYKCLPIHDPKQGARAHSRNSFRTWSAHSSKRSKKRHQIDHTDQVAGLGARPPHEAERGPSSRPRRVARRSVRAAEPLGGEVFHQGRRRRREVLLGRGCGRWDDQGPTIERGRRCLTGRGERQEVLFLVFLRSWNTTPKGRANSREVCTGLDIKYPRTWNMTLSIPIDFSPFSAVLSDSRCMK